LHDAAQRLDRGDAGGAFAAGLHTFQKAAYDHRGVQLITDNTRYATRIAQAFWRHSFHYCLLWPIHTPYGNRQINSAALQSKWRTVINDVGTKTIFLQC
jgi:hypothetical protein